MCVTEAAHRQTNDCADFMFSDRLFFLPHQH